MDVANHLAIIEDLFPKNLDVYSLSGGRAMDLMPIFRQIQLRQYDHIAFRMLRNALQAHGKRIEISLSEFYNTIAHVISSTNAIFIGVLPGAKTSFLTKEISL